MAAVRLRTAALRCSLAVSLESAQAAGGRPGARQMTWSWASGLRLVGKSGKAATALATAPRGAPHSAIIPTRVIAITHISGLQSGGCVVTTLPAMPTATSAYGDAMETVCRRRDGPAGLAAPFRHLDRHHRDGRHAVVGVPPTRQLDLGNPEVGDSGATA